MPAPPLTATLEELSLAWQRVKADHASHRFVDHPHLQRWVEFDLGEWLREIQEELATGYTPRASQMCWAPKPNGLLRPGSVLEVKDEVVYNLLVGRAFPALHAELLDLLGEPDVSYQIARDPNDPEWIKTSFLIWTQWRRRSLERLEAGASFLLLADITGFYDNIDIKRLMSDVRRIHNAPDEFRLLTDCLNAWAHPRGRGIPQGYSASHLLAKLFLEPVDRTLANDGFSHLRYVDDFRIFLPSKLDGRKAIARLTELLHRRGLSLQSAKTKILDKADAVTEVDRVAVIIRDIADTLIAEIAEDEGIDVDYIPTWEIDKFLESREGPPPEILERAFDEHFGLFASEPFDKTVFRYLLTRLGKASSRVAVDFCLQSLRSKPEETAAILRYFSKIGLEAEERVVIEEYMGGESAALYDYQLYQLVRWFHTEGLQSDAVTALCRIWSFDHNRPPWLRSYAIAYLGANGDGSDLENLEDYIVRAGSSTEKADVVAAIADMETSRRNAVYGRLSTEGGLPARAVAVCKSST